ncbi:MAG: phosphohydrolase, partial [Desulfobacterales bacterium]
IARSILVKLGAQEALIDEVCDIIAHQHHPRPAESLNFKVVYDSRLLENIEADRKNGPMDPERLADWIERSFLTAGGRDEARETLLK